MSGNVLKGLMPLEGRLKLQKNNDFLLEELLAVPIADNLFSQCLLKRPEYEIILIEKERNGERNAVVKLLNIVIHCGENSYEGFIKALEAEGFKSAVTKLNETSVSEEMAETEKKSHPWIDSMGEQKSRMVVTEKQLSSFSSAFGLNWESVALNLGCTQAQISQSKMGNPHSVHMQIFNTLNKWRQKKASGATLLVFLTALRDSESAEIDWEKVKTIVDKI